MIIGGLQKNTLVDFPGKLACTVFISGCNFSCPWCYSAELVLPEKIRNHPVIPEDEVFAFLKERVGLLEGVVICGGEPTRNSDLPEFIKKIKDLGYLVKLDTNGTNPTMLASLIDNKLIDYVAMDIKTSKEKYPSLFAEKVKIADIQKSIDILSKNKIGYEFRTTVVPTIHEREDIISIANWIKGAPRYYLQRFRPEKTIDPAFEKIRSYPDEWFQDVLNQISPLFKICQVRG